MSVALVNTTALEIERVRGDLDLTEISPPDEVVDDMFLRAQNIHGAENSDACFIQVKLIIARRLKMMASRGVDYTANTSKLSVNQVYEHLKDICNDLKEELGEAVSLYINDIPQVNFGSLHKTPTRLYEFPDDYPPIGQNFANRDVSREWWN